MDPLTIAIIAGLAVMFMQKRAAAAPTVDAPAPEPTAPVTANIGKALAGVAIVTGVVAGIDAIGDALEKQEMTYDWKHQIRDVLLNGDADHLYVANPEAPLDQQILVSRTRANLRIVYDFAKAIHPRPSGVHDPFVFSDAWGWYTDYYVRGWTQVQDRITEAKAQVVVTPAPTPDVPVPVAPLPVAAEPTPEEIQTILQAAIRERFARFRL